MNLTVLSKISGVVNGVPPRLKKIEAPYLAQASRLIAVKSCSVHRLFYRLTGESNESPSEIFAIGEFQTVEVLWENLKALSNPWDYLNSEIDKLISNPTGLFGTIDYETGYGFESRWRSLPVPSTGYAFKFYKIPCWYQVNHLTKTAEICYIEGCSPNAITTLREAISAGARQYKPSSSVRSRAIGNLVTSGEITEEQYSKSVELILDDISAGRFYELNFTQRFHEHSEIPPNQLFAAIDNELKPSKAFYSESKSEAICGFSPELYIHKTGKVVVTRPIKGSYRGVVDAKSLAKLEAEHIMVVDLARNDLGRISDLAPVSCPEVLSRRSLGSLYHLESQINGYTSKDWLSILKNTYPAASITGAPKVEVVQAISEYEPSPRGLYTGTCGWICPNGNVDLNVAIRTLVATKSSQSGWNYSMGSGGAIVADSTAADEYGECLQKISPFIRALRTNE